MINTNNIQYNSIFDLCKIDSSSVNKRALESLVQAGACDDLSGHRGQQFHMIDEAIRYGQKYIQESNSSQESLFKSSNSISILSDSSPKNK